MAFEHNLSKVRLSVVRPESKNTIAMVAIAMGQAASSAKNMNSPKLLTLPTKKRFRLYSILYYRL